MLYINLPSVIVGKHQNTFAEVNLPYVYRHKIPVIRRLSGGGTVFHDTGNLNFTFITQNESGKQIDFQRFTEPILNALHQLGIPATRSGRNDLLLDGLKISGNAEHVHKNRTLHHGTLLYNASLDTLRDAIHVPKDQISDNAVKSVRSPVTNIFNYIKEGISIETFRFEILSHVQKSSPENEISEFTQAEKLAIETLAATKYATWDWNFGYSPKCHVQKITNILGIQTTVDLEINKGKIAMASVYSSQKDFSSIQENILNLPYDISVIQENLQYTGESELWIERLF